MRHYDLLIFDFDGTLADSFPFFLEVFDTLADAHHFRRLDRSRLEELRGADVPQIMRHVGLPRWKLLPVAMHFRTLMAQSIGSIRLFDGVPDVLRSAAADGVLLAIVSSNSEANVRAVLGDDARLFAHFECGAALFGKRRRLRRVLQGTGVADERVLCVGDEVRDIDAAHAEGLDFGAVGWGYARPEALRARAPKLMFGSVEEMAVHLGCPVGY
ncbi:HAD hydrolase-like protein [Pseudoduganella umbonata]|uniref:HAD family hydrolase n=1 Tax=Pseudoduganella umbonata TaxID=864828 RepID=A0A4P8HQT9_9BURK|nr:HAD hydrolase-like protein [Pseudoduganella umbonata]MBB3220280.1 phosphoglycolate phosphatase [Pseudoduganella umbonata]QCP12179.1 HAD family hydrolase [Pseudoduganella umbonata]